MYAHSKDTYENNLKQFEELAKDIEKKVGNAELSGNVDHVQ